MANFPEGLPDLNNLYGTNGEIHPENLRKALDAIYQNLKLVEGLNPPQQATEASIEETAPLMTETPFLSEVVALENSSATLSSQDQFIIGEPVIQQQFLPGSGINIVDLGEGLIGISMVVKAGESGIPLFSGFEAQTRAFKLKNIVDGDGVATEVDVDGDLVISTAIEETYFEYTPEGYLSFKLHGNASYVLGGQGWRPETVSPNTWRPALLVSPQALNVAGGWQKIFDLGDDYPDQQAIFNAVDEVIFALDPTETTFPPPSGTTFNEVDANKLTLKENGIEFRLVDPRAIGKGLAVKAFDDLSENLFGHVKYQLYSTFSEFGLITDPTYGLDYLAMRFGTIFANGSQLGMFTKGLRWTAINGAVEGGLELMASQSTFEYTSELIDGTTQDVLSLKGQDTAANLEFFGKKDGIFKFYEVNGLPDGTLDQQIPMYNGTTEEWELVVFRGSADV